MKRQLLQNLRIALQLAIFIRHHLLPPLLQPPLLQLVLPLLQLVLPLLQLVLPLLQLALVLLLRPLCNHHECQCSAVNFPISSTRQLHDWQHKALVRSATRGSCTIGGTMQMCKRLSVQGSCMIANTGQLHACQHTTRV